MIRSAVVVAIVIAASAISSAQAQVGYKSQASPLVVTHDNLRQGGAYGDLHRGQASWTTDNNLQDFQPGGSGVYATGVVQNATCPQQSCQFQNDYNDRTTDWTGNHWVNFPVNGDPNPGYIYSRLNVAVCEDIRYHPDPCSGSYWTGWDKN